MRGPRLRFMYHQMMPPTTMMIPAMIHTHGTSAVVVGVADICSSKPLPPVLMTSSRGVPTWSVEFAAITRLYGSPVRQNRFRRRVVRRSNIGRTFDREHVSPALARRRPGRRPAPSPPSKMMLALPHIAFNASSHQLVVGESRGEPRRPLNRGPPRPECSRPFTRDLQRRRGVSRSRI
jgi:hypothetical protein